MEDYLLLLLLLLFDLEYYGFELVQVCHDGDSGAAVRLRLQCWDWEDLLDFHLDSDSAQPMSVEVTREPPDEVLLEPSSSDPGKVRKLWSNFFSGSVPFVCLEINKKLMKIGGGGGEEDWAWEEVAKIIDKSLHSSDGSTLVRILLAKVACLNHGFLLLANHGVDLSLVLDAEWNRHNFQLASGQKA